MIKEQNIGERIESLIKQSNSIAVIPSKIAGADAFCAGAALYYMLKEQGKNACLVYPGKIPEISQGIINEEDITRDAKNRSLYVSIDYSGTNAAKVHYSTEDDVLYLKISPIPSNFDKDQRVFSKISGFEFDLIITLGATSIDDLGNSFENLDISSKLSKILNIDNSSKNERFGFINAIEQDVTSISLLIFQKSSGWGLKPNDKAAKALLKGIESKEPRHRN